MNTTLQDIFISNYESYRKHHGVSIEQHQASEAIMTCRTEALGHEEWVCLNGDHVEQEPHSCRHRSCPRCHGAQTHQWLEMMQERLLPCDHYHLVITLPHELLPLWQYNRHWSVDRLFKGAVETISQLLSDERYLGAEVGIIATLHTWGRTLSAHPHVHLLVTGSGLNRGKCRHSRKDFLLPVGVIKAKFRGKWLSWLNAAYAEEAIRLPPSWNEGEWIHLLRQLARKEWNVRIQGAYRHGNGVLNYLSRYVRGGPIKEKRIKKATEEEVEFQYRDHHDGKDKRMRLKTEHFIERLLWHVPNKGQHNVRYYGLYSPGAREKRNKMRALMGVVKSDEKRKDVAGKERRCPKCQAVLFHSSSTRRKISYIKSKTRQQAPNVQQNAEPALAFPFLNMGPTIQTGPPAFFGPPSGWLAYRYVI